MEESRMESKDVKQEDRIERVGGDDIVPEEGWESVPVMSEIFTSLNKVDAIFDEDADEYIDEFEIASPEFFNQPKEPWYDGLRITRKNT